MACLAEQEVVAAMARHHVVAQASEQVVVQRVAAESVVVGRAVHALDAAVAVTGCLAGVATGAHQPRHHTGGRMGIAGIVVAGPTLKAVGPVAPAPVEDVIAVPA
jgi:hypothetical protein